MTFVRLARPDDYDRWLPLWRGYQAFYKAEIPETVTERTWRRFFDPNEPMRCAVAADGERMVGLVHYIFHRSCWTEGDYCYLQDLFTSDECRGKGVGRALIAHVYAAAAEARAARVYWLTHETNLSAMKLYDKVADRSGFVQYRKMLG